MNIPLPPNSCGQMTFVGADVRRPGLSEIFGNSTGSKSAANLALNSATTPVVSERVSVQTAKINLPPGFTARRDVGQ